MLFISSARSSAHISWRTGVAAFCRMMQFRSSSYGNRATTSSGTPSSGNALAWLYICSICIPWKAGCPRATASSMRRTTTALRTRAWCTMRPTSKVSCLLWLFTMTFTTSRNLAPQCGSFRPAAFCNGCLSKSCSCCSISSQAKGNVVAFPRTAIRCRFIHASWSKARSPRSFCSKLKQIIVVKHGLAHNISMTVTSTLYASRGP